MEEFGDVFFRNPCFKNCSALFHYCKTFVIFAGLFIFNQIILFPKLENMENCLSKDFSYQRMVAFWQPALMIESSSSGTLEIYIAIHLCQLKLKQRSEK